MTVLGYLSPYLTIPTISIAIAVVTCILICIFIAAWRIRRAPWSPIRVECWFCQSCSKIRRSDRFSWTCPQCLQYNGFNSDGDYNQSVPGQAVSVISSDAPRTCSNRISPSKYKSHSDVLCKKCSDNQQLKILQLARFEPLNEETYDAELQIFKAKLERSLRLCSNCESRSSALIRRCDRRMLPKIKEWKTSQKSVDESPSRQTSMSPHRFKYAFLSMCEILTVVLLLVPSSEFHLRAACCLIVVYFLRLISTIFKGQLFFVTLLVTITCFSSILLTIVKVRYILRLLSFIVFLLSRYILFNALRTNSKYENYIRDNKEKNDNEEMEGVEEEEIPRPPSNSSLQNGGPFGPSSVSSWQTAPCPSESGTLFSNVNAWKNLQHPSAHGSLFRSSVFSGQSAKCPSEAASLGKSSVNSWRNSDRFSDSGSLIRPSRLGLSLAQSVSSQITVQQTADGGQSVRLRSVSSYSPPASCCGSSVMEESDSRLCKPVPKPLWKQVCTGLLLGVNGAVIIYMVILPAFFHILKVTTEYIRAQRK